MLFYEEIFKSIQGEGMDTGKITTFVRLYGCNLSCGYCDQIQTGKKRRISLENAVSKIEHLGARNVCITGGEPLLQPDVYALVYELLALYYDVSIETNGTVRIPDYHYNRSFHYTMDVKGPSSGFSTKNYFPNLELLKRKDEVKFVIGNEEDYQFMKEILKKYPTKASILISPMFDVNMKSVLDIPELMNKVMEDGINARLNVQMHKLIGVK